MTEDTERTDRGAQRTLRAARPPEDLVDATNAPNKADERAQTPVDALGDIGDDDILVERGRRPSRSGG